MKINDLLKIDRATIPEEHALNMEDLCERVSVIEKAFGKEFTVSSGYRSKTDHERIYNEINSRRAAQKLPPLRVPMGSRHLSGNAVDVADPGRFIGEFVKANVSLLEEVGLWCEDLEATSKPNPWVHFQRVPPGSGNRFFKL